MRFSWKWVRRAVRGGGFVCLLPLAAAGAQGANAGTITLGPAPATLRISVAVPGLEPTAVTATQIYNVRAGKANKPQKVSASLNTAMPAGVTLTVQLTAPTGATSNGAVALDATVRDLVGNITNTVLEPETITYTLSATVAAGVVPFSSRTVTFTIASWP